MPGEVVRVTGLRELNAAFAQMDGDMYQELRLALKAIAARVIAVAVQRMPFVTGTAARSLRPRATQRGAGIAWPAGNDPDDKAGYYPWLDFGGSTGVGHRPHTAWSGSVRRDWRGHPGSGRYLYPAISGELPKMVGEINGVVVAAARRAGFDVVG